ncbi:hypothetical protein PUV54_02380 [Hyphococcus flavus]|uniref:Uncharacterized protein n=1 Tax=Hyphococcus flavus TaxID=1866326 RepID=A0AAF0CF04_9PROT|nr:hypothetical protein [Hyphococcus flavus]WDI32036.1 hypothetical protein PUV54_02380 [Hyphococcus flavus]
MTEPADKDAPDHDVNEDAKNAAEDAERVRFRSIVEAEGRDADLPRGFHLVRRDERRWNAMSRQIWQVARLTAVFVIVAILLGLPIGNWLAHSQIERMTGVERPWNPLAIFEMETLLFAFILPVMVLFVGYALSRILTMLNAAESIAVAAQRFVTPDVTAVENVNTVGAVVETHMATLNEGLDNALTRLASVEAMIRQHVEAIEIAGDAIDQKAASAVGRVADERSRLMELTESLNAHADSFAAAIAEKANATIESLQSAETLSKQSEQEFDDRLIRLETAAERAFNSFESLREALRDVDESMRNSAQSIDASSEETRKAMERANAAADAAAESAARNAANIGAAASRAGDEAKKAADHAIETAREHAERSSRGAIEAASEESERVQDAAAKALEEITKSTSGALAAATEGATKATKAAEDVSEAARKSSEAAEKASSDVTAASERARKSSEDAMKIAETEATRIEERNQALAEARAALEKENARLESLIEEQRKRADRLAEAISSQTDRLSRLAEAQLREQEAAARLALAQNEMQERADRQAAERKAAEKKAAEERLEKELKAQAEADKQAEEAKKAGVAQAALDLGAASRTEPKVIKPVLPDPKKVKTTNGAGAARLDELARDIAERRPSKGGKRKEPPLTLGRTDSARKKGDVSWREILDAADDGAPLDLGAAAKEAEAKAAKEQEDAENAIRIIARLQDFTYHLETRLYGDPPPALQERFDKGDRNVFANRLLRLNEADVKRRIRTESGRDRKFENGVHEFLQGFEQLLEDATTSETADEELEEYLSSPLGRVYLLIGATVGYFA